MNEDPVKEDGYVSGCIFGKMDVWNWKSVKEDGECIMNELYNAVPKGKLVL
jgi:hypothetical protein